MREDMIAVRWLIMNLPDRLIPSRLPGTDPANRPGTLFVGPLFSRLAAPVYMMGKE